MTTATFVPDFAITLNGAALSPTVKRHITQVQVSFAPDQADQLTLTLANPAPQLPWTQGDQTELFTEGSDIQVVLGYIGQRESIFQGEVVTLMVAFPAGGAVTLTVQALGYLHRLQGSSVVATYLNQTNVEIADQIARRVGLSASGDDNTVKHAYVLQNNQTDIDFLRQRARASDHELLMEGKTLLLRKRQQNAAEVCTLVWGSSAGAGENRLPLTDFQATLHSKHQIKRATVQGYDPLTGEALVGQHSGENNPTGAQAGNAAIELLATRTPVASQAEADQAAQALYAQRARHLITGSGTTIGFPRLRAGSKIKLAGLGQRFAGLHTVTAATHTLDSAGYVTHFTLNEAEPGLLDTLTASTPQRGGTLEGVVVGLVTNNEDPEGLGRVKVRFPWLSEAEESQWARLATPMGGKERGFYFLPEVDDEVLVAFEQGDVRFPYVVGALWNGKAKPPLNNEDGKNNLRLIKSRSGHLIRFNDEAGKELIEIRDQSDKNSIVLDTANKTITIESEQDILLKAPQGMIKLDAQKVEVKSSAASKIEAGAGLDVKASATLNIKGATVNIN